MPKMLPSTSHVLLRMLAWLKYILARLSALINAIGDLDHNSATIDLVGC